MRIGVISDTHGVLFPQAEALLDGVDEILHAGDIGDEAIIRRLQAIAPVSAVTGNVDWGGPLERRYPRSLTLELAGCSIYMTHIGGKPEQFAAQLPQLPGPLTGEPRRPPQVAICGHSHIALLERRQGVLYLNPGSASSGRFGRGLSLAILSIDQGQPHADILPIQR